MPDDGDQWEDHDHEPMVHSHGHYHVTHNYRDMTGGFEHLSSRHEHEHDHAAIRHRHYPHADFEREHADEAHIHDHDVPVKGGESKTDGTKKTASRKAAAKKSS